MKRSPVVNDHLQMPSMYISQGSTMFLAKKSISKDGSFPPVLLQSETMFLLPDISWVADGLWKICLSVSKGL